jgi:RNA polymerase sigma-70 factor (ECF subfamily)
MQGILSQKTVLKAYENFEKVEHHEVFMFYMFGIASRLAKRRSRRLKFWMPFESHHNDHFEDHTADVARKMEIDSLYKAMNKLPEKQREAVSLYEISGFSLAEIQQIQGGSLSGVKSRISGDGKCWPTSLPRKMFYKTLSILKHL